MKFIKDCDISGFKKMTFLKYFENPVNFTYNNVLENLKKKNLDDNSENNFYKGKRTSSSTRKSSYKMNYIDIIKFFYK